MKKIFTLAAAVLASLTMTAQTTIFSAVPATSNQIKQSAAGFYEFTSEQATVTGGHMFMAHNDGTSARKYTDKQSNQAVFALDGSKAWFKIKLNVALQEGDTIIVEALTNGAGETNARGVWVALGSVVVRPSEAPACALLAQSETGKEFIAAKHIIQSTDDICGKDSISIWRATGNSTYFKSITIVRPEQKTIVSTEESLTAVTINDVAISATDLATLVSNKYLFLQDAYVTAPVVKFTKHIVITYDDQTTKESDEVIEVTSQPATTTWGASATINGDSYTVYAPKAASRTVTYMYGEQVLGTETVAVNGNPAEYAQYETMPLATFGGWYKDADLTQAVANIAAEVISVDATYYAAFDKAFLSESVNIEQLVLDNGTSYDIKSALTAAHFAYTDVDALDTLNDVDKKTNRNYAFLGLKVKKATSYLAFNLQQGHSVKVRMGNVAEAFSLKVNGAALDLATKTLANASVDDANVWEYTATDGDALIEFTGFTKDKTVVFKQIMIDEPIAAVVLPEPSAYALSLAEVQNGSLAVKVNDAAIDLSKKNVLIGATVTITATPDEGYKVVDVQVNGVSLNAVEGVYSFEMPAEAVVISATFEVDPTTAINNTEAEVKAVKFFQNGQLMIKKNGVVYNAQGAIVK